MTFALNTKNRLVRPSRLLTDDRLTFGTEAGILGEEGYAVRSSLVLYLHVIKRYNNLYVVFDKAACSQRRKMSSS
jgi:hypothetical protein